MRGKLALFGAVATSLLVASETRAESIEDKFKTPGRTPLALHVGASLNDPIPAVFGIQVAISLFDMVRLQGGVGRFQSQVPMPDGTMLNPMSTTFGIGVRGRLPGYVLPPVVGVTWASISTEGFPNADRHVYLAGGFEWRPIGGLEVGAGYGRSFDSRIGDLPYMTTSWNLPI